MKLNSNKLCVKQRNVIDATIVTVKMTVDLQTECFSSYTAPPVWIISSFIRMNAASVRVNATPVTMTATYVTMNATVKVHVLTVISNGNGKGKPS